MWAGRPGFSGKYGEPDTASGLIDRRQQSQIPAGVVHLASTVRDGILILPKPDPVVSHPTRKRILGCSAGAPVTGPVLTAQITCQGERHLVDVVFWIVVVFDFNAIVGVDTLDFWHSQVILSVPILIEDHRQPFLRPVQKLPSQTQVAVVLVVRLPTVNDPGLDLQLLRGKPLNSQSIEEPRCVGRDEGRLVNPIIEVVVAEQADVRHEDSGIDVQAAGSR